MDNPYLKTLLKGDRVYVDLETHPDVVDVVIANKPALKAKGLVLRHSAAAINWGVVTACYFYTQRRAAFLKESLSDEQLRAYRLVVIEGLDVFAAAARMGYPEREAYWVNHHLRKAKVNLGDNY